MEKFLSYLKDSKKNVESLETIQIVLGNQSCDLDGAVSTLALGFLLYAKNKKHENVTVIPVLNVEEKYFHLRTLAYHLFKQIGLDKTMLTFRNQVDWTKLQDSAKVETFLVDHHVLSDKDKKLKDTVVEIFDHRPIILHDLPNSGILKKIVISPVGSCTTLISNEIINTDETLIFSELAHLLYSAIIFDTIDLKEEYGRVTPMDVSIIGHLVNKLGQFPKLSFQGLWSLHIDISRHSTKDLLYKDLKIVQHLPIPGVPMLVEHYFQREDAIQALEEFSKEFNTNIVVVIGLETTPTVQRDIGFYYNDEKIKNFFVEYFKDKGKALNLQDDKVNIPNAFLFKQNNIKLTRKFILPLINEALNKYNSNA